MFKFVLSNITHTQSVISKLRGWNGLLSTKRKDLVDICSEFYGSLSKGQQSLEKTMAKVLDVLPISFTDAMNEK